MSAAFEQVPAQRVRKFEPRNGARYEGDQQKTDPGMPRLDAALDGTLDGQAAPLEGIPAYARQGTDDARTRAAIAPDAGRKPDDGAQPADPSHADPAAANDDADHPADATPKRAAEDGTADGAPGAVRDASKGSGPPAKTVTADGRAAASADAAGKAGTRTKPAAKRGGKGGGGGAGADDDDDDAPDLVDEPSDQQAASQLITEWFTEPPVMFEDNPLSVTFEGTPRIELKVTPPPKQQAQEGAGSNAMSAEDAGRQAGETYAQAAGRARDAHDFMVEEANRGARRVFEQAGEAIGRLDLQLQPTLDGIVGTMNSCRRDLAGALDASEAHLEAEARHARRRAGGTAAAGRSAVTASAKRAVDVELPKVRTELREQFVTLYDTTSKSIADSGAKTSEALHDAAGHKKLLDHPDYNDTGTAEERAAKEAARPEIPPRLNHLGDTIKKGCDKNAEQIKARLDTAPPNGGSSIGKGIDDFVDSMRHNITGDAKGAGAAATARAKTGGATDAAAATEGAKASEAIASSGSLESRGHKAVGKSHAEALRSLRRQLAAARKSVRHAKRSGEKQLVTQRSAALTRLAGLRKMRIDALRETANQAAKALRTGAKGAVAFYGESTKRLGDSLQRAAERGPAALTETTTQGVPPVATAIADGQKLQALRLGQVTQSAGRSVARLSDTVQPDARGASVDFDKAMGDISATLGAQVGDAAHSHSRHFADVSQGIAATTRGFTQPLPVMFKQAIDDTKKNIKPVYDSEQTAMDKSEKSVTDNNKKMADNPNEQIGDRLRTAKIDRDKNLGDRAKGMRAAWGIVMLDEDALMENARGVTALGGNSVRAKFPGDLDYWLKFEYDRTLGGLNADEYNAITNYLAGRTDEGARYELKTTVHWYGNEGKRATKVMEDIGSDARKELVGRSDWKSLADEVKGGLHGTDQKVFEALEIDRAVLAKAYRAKDSVDTARNKNEKEALFTALTPYQGEVIRDGKVVSAEEQLAEFQREFAVVIGKAKAPAAISQKEAAEALADYATRPVKVLVEEGYGEHSNMVERTYTLSGPETALARSLAISGPNSEETKAARMLHESERTGGKVNLEALESAVIDPRLNPALTPDLTKEQRDMARAQQDQLFVKYAELAKKYGVKVEGGTPKELREFVAGRLGAKFDEDSEGQLGARYAKSIVLKDRPDAVAAMRYAMERSGTDVGLMRRTLGRLSREDVKTLARDYNIETGKNMYDQLGVYGYSGGEVSGDERLEIEVLLMGFPQNDRERGEVALYKNLQQQRETGVAGKAALSGSIEEQRMLAADADLRRVMGGTIEYDEFNRPIQKGGSFDQKGRYSGANDTAFLLAVNRASYTAESYAAAIDRLAAGITAIIAVIGAVVAAVLTVVTGGLAAPLMIAALSFGLAGMAANSLIRGGRYGWEEALTDLAMVGVQVLTAGAGAQLGAAAKTANTAAAAARTGGAAVAKTGLAKLFTGNPLVDQIIIGSITGGIGGVGQTALQGETWQNGLLEGIGNSLVGGVRGSLSGAATAAATNSLEALPVGRGAVAAMRAGKDYRSLGTEIGRMSAGGGPIRGTLRVAGRSVARGGLQAVGGAAGRATELAFDTATGKYQGSLTQALDQISEASLRAGFQGLAEGGGEAFGQSRRDTAHPQEAIDREQHRMQLIGEENAALRGALHTDAMAAAQPPPGPELPMVARLPAAAEAGPTVPGARSGTPADAIAGAAGRSLQTGTTEPALGARAGVSVLDAPGAGRPASPPAETAGLARPAVPASTAETGAALARTPIAEEAARIARPTSGETDTRPLVKPAAATQAPGAPRAAGADRPEPIAVAAPRRTGEAEAPAPAGAARPRADEEAQPGRRVAETEGAQGMPPRRLAAADEQSALAQAKRAGLHEELEGAAARIAGSEMQLEPRAVIRDPQAALAKALPEVFGERGPLRGRVLVDESFPGPGVRVLLDRADGEMVWVRIVVGETEAGNVASFARSAGGDDHFVVTLSPRARETTHSRALAHELEELRFHRSPTDNAKPAAGPEADLLRASRQATDADAPLSPHDRGRLAELQVLAEQIRGAHGRSDAMEVARLQGEIDTLAAHLGLLHTDAGDPRFVKARDALPEKGPARAELDDARNRGMTPGGEDSLRPARGLPDDPRLSAADRRRLAQFDETANQLAGARQRGDRQEIFRLTRELANQAQRMGLLANDTVTARRAALAEMAFESDSFAARTLAEIRSRFATEGGNDAMRPGLTPDANTVLSPRDRTQLADLDAALVRLRAAELAGADPRVVTRLRNDAESRATALGLVHGGNAADRRAALARTALGDAASAALEGIRTSARDNPLLRPRMGTLEDLPLLAQQIIRAQAMADTRLATELTEIAMLRLRDAGVTSGDRPVRAEARAEIERIVGVDPVARALVEDASQRQSARQRGELLRDAADSVRRDIADARERLSAAAADRKEIAPGVIRRAAEENAIRREIDALQRRAADLNEAAERAERIAFRPAGMRIDAALAAGADDPRFAIAPRLRSDPDYPGNPNTVRLVTQQYGDSPQFQSWQHFRQLYYDVFPSPLIRFGLQSTNPEHIERIVFARWRTGEYVSESTRGVRTLGEMDLILAGTPTPVDAPAGTTRAVAGTQDVPIRVRAADGSLVQQKMTVTEAESRRLDLIDTRADRQRKLDATSNPQQRRALQGEINELIARINDVSESLGVAAGKEFAKERFGNTGKLTEGSGSGVPDLIHENPATGRISVIECKGGTSELGTRRATSEGRTVQAEQTTPEYLRSLAQTMIRSGSAEMQVLGQKIIDALNKVPPNIDVFVVRQPFEDGGNRGAIDVKQYPVDRSGR